MNCHKCNKKVNSQEIIYQDKLPLYVGYSSPTTARCCSCKKILCEKCYHSWGRFIFTCKEETCRQEMKNMNILEKII